MDNNIYVQSYWPTHIFFTDHPEPSALNDKLEVDIYKWMQKDDGVSLSNQGGWHSQTNMGSITEFEVIRDWITEQVERVAEKSALMRGTRLQLVNMWANVNSKNSYNVTHHHPNSTFSGVYYVKVPKPESKIWFLDPRTQSKMMPIERDGEFIEDKPDFWDAVFFTPREGMLILFPSYLDHRVDANLADEDRISISFNFIQRRVE